MIVIRKIPDISKWINDATTINKPYNVISCHGDNLYLIKNDENYVHWVSGLYFKEINQHREEKLNTILDDA